MRARAATLALGATLAALIVVPGAVASTEIKLREAAPGITNYTPNAEFVELQMIADGQANVAGRKLRFYAPNGTQKAAFDLPGNVSNGATQHTVLLGTSDVASSFGVQPDFVYSGPRLENVGGAVCYGQLDCVAWGSFSGALPSPAGAPAPVIPEGRSLTRTIARGCPTALDPADDSDSSAADFAVTQSPTPRRNTTAPTETPCDAGGGDRTAPETRITSGPRKLVRTKKKRARARFSYRSSEAGSSFECRLDRGRWFACNPPTVLKVKRGKHRFLVRATDRAGNTDRTPAEQVWKVKKKKKKKKKKR